MGKCVRKIKRTEGPEEIAHKLCSINLSGYQIIKDKILCHLACTGQCTLSYQAFNLKS